MNKSLRSFLKKSAIKNGPTLISGIPTVVEIRLKNCNTLFNGLDLPFDYKLHEVMVEVCKKLVEKNAAVIGYVSFNRLFILLNDYESDLRFGGNVEKTLVHFTTSATGMFTSLFTDLISKEKIIDDFGEFSCKAIQFLDRETAVKYLLQAEFDNIKLAIKKAGEIIYPNGELDGKPGILKTAMVTHTDSYEKLSSRQFLYGSFVRKFIDMIPCEKYPVEMQDKIDPEGVVRTFYGVDETLVLSKIVNMVETIYDAKDPIYC